MGSAVELNDALSIFVQLHSLLQDGRPGDITRHLGLILPALSHLALFSSKTLNVLFNLLAEEDLLEADQRAVLKRQFFVLEQLIEVCTKLSHLELE